MNRRPNLLLLMTDQQRADALGCVSDWVNTPHLDRLAQEGVRFRNCVTTSPVCIPARLSLATGLYPHNTWVWDNGHHTLDPRSPTWMQAVRAAGYRTSLFGKTHLHPHGGDLRDREHLMHEYGLDDVDEIGGPRASARVLSHMTAGWEHLGLWRAYREDLDDRFATKPHVARPSPLPLAHYADTYVGEGANAYLRDYDGDQPWCCWVSFGGPHEPWDTPDEFARRYDPDQMPASIPLPEWASHPGDRPLGALDKRLAQRPALDPQDVAAMRANYAGNVELIDDQIGQILATLESRGDLDNTLIIFTSDHGEMNGDFGLIYKSQLLNSAVRVPLIVRPPKGAIESQGAINDSPAEWMDVGATLCEMGGTRAVGFSQSLLPGTADVTHHHRTGAISEMNGEVMWLDVDHKAVLNTDGEVYLLFDRHSDPDEQDNLAGTSRAADDENRLRLRILERLMQTQVRA
ncbi:MAG: sulfatase-like hydrolase/transferase [Gemmatimonadetes bacterium]|nr:sulfatase-like hydrolase/transferase [Gemmatimonadota bacterium]MBT5059290.1 sulfatase-like hydrolase/transferase [Gemmatimonadota bacterium]MBT5145540.1 sulfatase-like hydrolase/transferase [Gemmatimonadota bacterium]MBT5591728.1 sulfatase-like hydrolase/transferase [Gemmatimonadota bacterium]MBT5961817.1 sulfatase-like hydrolase/transferase [Gemmatimonadota bacterium]